MGDNNSHDDDDEDLFARIARDARPLKQDKIAPHRERRRPLPEQSRRDEQEVLESLLSDDYVPHEVESGEELFYSRGGLQHKVLRRLRRGDYAIEARLDLHRLTVPQAREALAGFLRNAGQHGQRCVKIIHGKGLGSAGGLPVLKNKLNSWLRQRNEVLAFCSALANDGGTGAVYVLLKRQ